MPVPLRPPMSSAGPSSPVTTPDFAPCYSPILTPYPSDRYHAEDFYRLTNPDGNAYSTSLPTPSLLHQPTPPRPSPDFGLDQDPLTLEPSVTTCSPARLLAQAHGRPVTSPASRISHGGASDFATRDTRTQPKLSANSLPPSTLSPALSPAFRPLESGVTIAAAAGRPSAMPRPGLISQLSAEAQANARSASHHSNRSPKVVATAQNSTNSRDSSLSTGSRGLPPDAPLDTCILEDNSGIAQSFLESTITVDAPVSDGTPSPTDSSRQHDFAATEHASGKPVDKITPCDCCWHCGRNNPLFQIGRRVGRRSKSHTTLRTGISELSGWDVDQIITVKPVEAKSVKLDKPRAGEAELEKLPVEILDAIIVNLALDLPPSGHAPRNVDLIACLLTSKTIHVATINILYRQITVPHSSIFSKFLAHIVAHPGLGTLVRRLDLSHFTSVGFGRSRQSTSEIPNLTPKTLLKCLELTPWVQEVLLQEGIDDEIDARVLDKLFFHLPKLRALDFCASSSELFKESFAQCIASFASQPTTMLGLRRLSLHDCSSLPASAFEVLLPNLPHLTHLDVSHTRVTDLALTSIPHSARLTHLNLGRCTQLSGERIVDFLLTHPAVKALFYLNLSSGTSHYRILHEADLHLLLPALPSTLRSLNLNGAGLNSSHVRHLIPLTSHLEELGLAHSSLNLADVNSLFRRSATTPTHPPSQLHYIDLSNIPTITQSTIFNTPAPQNTLLSLATCPLEVIELGDKAISSLRECRNTNKRLGWCVKELGRRGWYVREPIPCVTASLASGRRSWKMGAMWWGMRKVPVAWGEVGGVYGHYMFKK